eukprot:7356948-Lingulodinium_polyedra.AAC.1
MVLITSTVEGEPGGVAHELQNILGSCVRRGGTRPRCKRVRQCKPPLSYTVVLWMTKVTPSPRR